MQILFSNTNMHVLVEYIVPALVLLHAIDTFLGGKNRHPSKNHGNEPWTMEDHDIVVWNPPSPLNYPSASHYP